MTEPREDWDGFEATQSELEDQTTYPAKLVGLTMKELPSSFSESGKAKAIIWTFSIDDSEETVDGTSSLATGPRSKARPWIDALLGRATASEMMKAGGVRKDALVGKECTVLIAINDNGYPKVANVLPPQRRETPQDGPGTPEPSRVASVSNPPGPEPPAPSDAPWDKWQP